MSQVLVVSGTGTDVGKTIVTAAIAANALREGQRVVVRRYTHTIRLLHPVGHDYYNIHFDRACVGYPQTNASNLFAANQADVLNPNPTATGVFEYRRIVATIGWIDDDMVFCMPVTPSRET